MVAVVPSDHVILNEAGFRATLSKAASIADVEAGIVTIGITPHFPHTGYGYIECAENSKVESFREKPDFETAKKYVASGKYLWNAGMFVAQLDVLLNEFALHAPEMYAYFDQLVATTSESEMAALYAQIPAESIDYAVMEKSARVYVVPAGFDWNDLGSWDALESVIKAQDGNTIARAREVLAIESSGNIVFAPNKIVALLGVKDLAVVLSEDVVAVFPKQDSQRIKELVELAKKRGLEGLL